jgi:succinate dehydrogenase hydrophobic anchor subunit
MAIDLQSWWFQNVTACVYIKPDSWFLTVELRVKLFNQSPSLKTFCSREWPQFCLSLFFSLLTLLVSLIRQNDVLSLRITF